MSLALALALTLALALAVAVATPLCFYKEHTPMFLRVSVFRVAFL